MINMALIKTKLLKLSDPDLEFLQRVIQTEIDRQTKEGLAPEELEKLNDFKKRFKKINE